MNRPSADWNKLARHVAGELSATESDEMRKWLDANPADARAIAALETATKQLRPSTPVDVEAALRRVKTKLRPATRWRMYVALAAAAALVLVAGRAWLGRTSSGSASVPTEYATTVGERDSIVLADGSRVLLGPASHVAVRGRDVELVGEAYFVVTHDAKRPFTVRAGGAVIRDIGTEFSVHSDRSETVRVVVREGSVQLGHLRDSVVLSQGDVGTIESGGRVSASRGAATDDDLAWTRGQLVFKDASVGELRADLRRWYGVELRVTDSALLRRHFTGSFVSEPANRVVDAIALALGARADRRGDTVYIRSAAAAK
jgi:transmembrane sensor